MSTQARELKIWHRHALDQPDWFHPDCDRMSPEKFKLLLEWVSDGSPSPWKCDVCSVSTVKLDKAIKALTVRQDNLETRQDEIEDRVEATNSKIENTQLRLEKVEDQVQDRTPMNMCGKSYLRGRERRPMLLCTNARS